MTKVRYVLTALALTAAACSSPATEATPPEAPASTVPAEIAALVTEAVPGIMITNGELNDDEYEVVGTVLNGDEIEVDLVQSNGAWAVLEIQRDVEWSYRPGAGPRRGCRRAEFVRAGARHRKHAGGGRIAGL